MALVRASRGLKSESQEIVTLLLQDNVAVNSIRGGTTPLCEAVKSGMFSFKLEFYIDREIRGPSH